MEQFDITPATVTEVDLRINWINSEIQLIEKNIEEIYNLIKKIDGGYEPLYNDQLSNTPPADTITSKLHRCSHRLSIHRLNLNIIKNKLKRSL